MTKTWTTSALLLTVLLVSGTAGAGIHEGADPIDPLEGGKPQPIITETPDLDTIQTIIEMWEGEVGLHQWHLAWTGTTWRLELFLPDFSTHSSWVGDEQCHYFTGFIGPRLSCAACTDNFSSCYACAHHRTMHAMAWGMPRTLNDYQDCVRSYGLR